MYLKKISFLDKYLPKKLAKIFNYKEDRRMFDHRYMKPTLAVPSELMIMIVVRSAI